MIKKILGLAATAALALGATSAQAASIPLGGTVSADGDYVDIPNTNITTSTFNNSFNFRVNSSIDLAMEATLSYVVTTDVTTFNVVLNQCTDITCVSKALFSTFTVSGTGGRYLLISPIANGYYQIAVSGTANLARADHFSGQASFYGVPEPATLGLLGAGLMGLGLVRRRRKA